MFRKDSRARGGKGRKALNEALMRNASGFQLSLLVTDWACPMDRRIVDRCSVIVGSWSEADIE